MQNPTYLATILAALRLYQSAGMGDPSNRTDTIDDIATNCHTLEALDSAGIDELIGRLQYGMEALTDAPREPSATGESDNDRL